VLQYQSCRVQYQKVMCRIIPLLRHYNACYKMQQCWYLIPESAVSYNKRYCRKSGIGPYTVFLRLQMHGANSGHGQPVLLPNATINTSGLRSLSQTNGNQNNLQQRYERNNNQLRTKVDGTCTFGCMSCVF
jgi:hypothetical protein